MHFFDLHKTLRLLGHGHPPPLIPTNSLNLAEANLFRSPFYLNNGMHFLLQVNNVLARNVF